MAVMAASRTSRVTGWPLGKTVSVKWKGETAEGLVAERAVSVGPRLRPAFALDDSYLRVARAQHRAEHLRFLD